MEDKEIKELETAVEQIWEVARGFGLDPYPTNFEIAVHRAEEAVQKTEADAQNEQAKADRRRNLSNLAAGCAKRPCTGCGCRAYAANSAPRLWWR